LGGETTPIERSNVHSSVKIWHPELVNIYDSEIGEGTRIASFVEIGGAKIGKNCKIEAYAFIPPGVTIGDNVFIGPHVVFTNDKYPKATGEWTTSPTTVCNGATIGANSTILSGITIGEKSMIGAGSVVCEDVKPHHIMFGEKAVARGTIH
jgi:acetyltransferase-like isoleucine patch superfamily enzyme